MSYLPQHHRATGLLLGFRLWAVKAASRRRAKTRNPNLFLLVLSLILIFVVLLAGAVLAGRIAQARWDTYHPPQTLVPELAGRDPISAEASVRGTQLRLQITYTAIDDQCWQDQPAPNTVVDQEPKAFTPVAANTEVHITVGLRKSQ